MLTQLQEERILKLVERKLNKTFDENKTTHFCIEKTRLNFNSGKLEVVLEFQNEGFFNIFLDLRKSKKPIMKTFKINKIN